MTTSLDTALSKLKHPSISENFFLGHNQIPPTEDTNTGVFPMVDFLSKELAGTNEKLPSYYERATEIICSDDPLELKESLLLGIMTYAGPKDSGEKEECTYAEYEFFREIMHHVAALTGSETA